MSRVGRQRRVIHATQVCQCVGLDSPPPFHIHMRLSDVKHFMHTLHFGRVSVPRLAYHSARRGTSLRVQVDHGRWSVDHGRVMVSSALRGGTGGLDRGQGASPASTDQHRLVEALMWP